MCAIVGVVQKTSSKTVQVREDVVRSMLERMEHRGRDCTGVVTEGNVTLGHNRLSIVDVSASANQPFAQAGGTLLMSYNGEIYNHTDLRSLSEHYSFATQSDTESLYVGFQALGTDVFKRIRGMFAVSFYDTEAQRITLAVDQFGIKPLYYIDTPEWFAWASELKAFRALPQSAFAIETGSLYEQGVFRTLAGKQTLVAGVRKLLPGELISYDVQSNQIVEHCHEYLQPLVAGDVLGLLRASVSEQLMGDAPVGIQLSGGVDSSLIAALACESQPAQAFHTFSIGLADPAWNEFPYSRLMAKQLGTRHHEILFTQEEFCETLPIATYHLDEPVAYPNTVPMLLLAREARKHVKVLLSGEGADELFGGYLRYLKFSETEIGTSDVLYSNAFCDPVIATQMFHAVHPQFSPERIATAEAGRHLPPLCRVGKYDLETFLPSLLLRQDKMGMAANLESRFPFLDPRLLSLVHSLPDQERINQGVTKRFLKAIAAAYVPEELINRRKCGFGLPISQWLRDPEGLGRYLSLLRRPGVRRAYLNYPYIEHLVDLHLSGKQDTSEVLWILISLEVWARVFIDEVQPTAIWKSLN